MSLIIRVDRPSNFDVFDILEDMELRNPSDHPLRLEVSSDGSCGITDVKGVSIIDAGCLNELVQKWLDEEF